MDSPTTIDRFPVSDLPARYGIQRSQAFDRRKHLGIKSYKDGQIHYISGEDLNRLDELDRHLQSGGTLATFGQPPASGERSPHEVAPVRIDDPPVWMLRFLELLSRSLPPAPPTPPLPQETIERAYQHGWQLSTSQLCELLGIKAIAGHSIDRYGFRFVRAGKTGRQAAWAIEKIGNKNSPLPQQRGTSEFPGSADQSS